ncbi:MAG: hypothetical protein ACLFTT_13480 [Candidatus Hydrogenedentota bacterium]
MCHYLLKQAWFYALAVFVLVALGTVLVSHTVQPTYVADLKARGLPATWQDLQTSYDNHPASENGAALVLGAAEALPNIDCDDTLFENLPYAGEARLPEPWEPVPPRMQQAIDRADKLFEESRALLTRAVTHQVIRFEIDFSLGFYIVARHTSLLRSLERFLAVHTLDAARKQRPQETAEALLLQLDLQRAFEKPPFLIGALVRIALDGIYIGVLEQAVNRVTLTPAQLRTIQAAMSQPLHRSLENMREALVNDLLIGMQESERLMVRVNEIGPDDTQASRTLSGKLRAEEVLEMDDLVTLSMRWHKQVLWRLSGAFAFTQLTYIRTMKSAWHTGSLPPHEALQYDFAEEILAKTTQYRSLHAHILLPALGRTYLSAARSIAYNDLGRVALALLRYHREQGGLPQALEALVPAYLDAVPIDPFSGAPLRYIRSENGFLVYSFGHDRDDDGGADPPKNESIMNDGDLNFEVRGLGM